MVVGVKRIGTHDLAGGIGPYLHPGTLLLRKIADQRIADPQKHRHHDRRDNQKYHGAAAAYIIYIGHQAEAIAEAIRSISSAGRESFGARKSMSLSL